VPFEVVEKNEVSVEVVGLNGTGKKLQNFELKCNYDFMLFDKKVSKDKIAL